jgi:hypothetical protein
VRRFGGETNGQVLILETLEVRAYVFVQGGITPRTAEQRRQSR